MATINVTAEWPGRVAEIHVAAGDTVAAEQELVTLESMKMLTPVTATSAGRVSAIAVAIDDFVDEGGVLLQIDV